MIIRDREYRDSFRKIVISQLPTEETFYFHPQIENYVFSNLGRVKNIITNKILKPIPNSQGYLTVNIVYNNGKGRRCAMIHRLVAESIIGFLGNDNYVYEVNHIDGNKTNNNISNLEWLTRQENLEHSRKNRLFKIHSNEKNGNCKLTNNDIKDIIELYNIGFRVCDIARSYKINDTYCSKICNKLVRRIHE